MNEIRIPVESDRFILHFETEKHEISAFALASALFGLAEAAREANVLANPGYSIEVLVEALEDGSFEARVHAVLTKTRDVFAEAPRQIIYGVISGYILLKIADTGAPVITVNDGSVIVEHADRTYIIPREVHELVQRAEKSERFGQSLGQLFRGAEADATVSALRIDNPDSPAPGPMVKRGSFALFDRRELTPEGDRAIVEYAHLEISRAILARGKRKWEFYWRGVKIPAPVTDRKFWDQFFAHEVKIAPGDVLRVALRITQRQDPDSGIYINSKYEVIEVLEHIPRMRQASF